ncbi:uncharacterized protein LOC108911683 [Anoplophora glabripennis]|uniref:uncharacterized protein LOC108911683 n=1 Tax=Anoplophora glabripennis TaxID=217634 RepID=UPI000C76ED48|nr:uncharacterized protein LOC108911683 [Anoplophora glabripennis]
MEQGSPKSPKSPTGYEKLTEEKPPKSPSRPFRLKFHRMLSTGSLKLGSSGSTPSSPCSEGSRYSFDSDSIEHLKRSGKNKHGVPKRKNTIKRKFAMTLGRKKCRKTQYVPLTAPSILITLISEEEGCSSAENSRPNSFTVADKKLLQKEQEKLEKKLRQVLISFLLNNVNMWSCLINFH